jgi:nitrite reductase (NO-forming)
VQEIAPGVKVPPWTFNGSMPAPIIHVRRGDEVHMTFQNKTPPAHSIDFHAATTPWNVWYQPVAPAFMHISSCMYGVVIVDAARPLPPAKEFALVESEFYFSGIADQYQDHPLVVRAGRRIRLYVLNAGPTLFAAFHVIGWIFDKVYVDEHAARHPDLRHPAGRERDVRADDRPAGRLVKW